MRNSASTIMFLKRFGISIDFTGKEVIDVGCGLGDSCFYIADKHAKKVVGVDINHSYLTKCNLALKLSPEYTNIAEFKHISEVTNEKYDIVISKDCFEHYAEPEKMVEQLKNYLKPNGLLLIGFSPLWYSPRGSHLRNMWIPWLHVLLPKEKLLNSVRRFYRDDSITDFRSFKYVSGGINQITLAEFVDVVSGCGLKFKKMQINSGHNLKTKIIFGFMNVFRRVPRLENYFTVNIYAIISN